MNKTNRSYYIAFLGIFTAVALILAFIESQIPTIIPVPGVKLGLPNIAIVIILYKIGFKESLIINIIRVLVVSLLFGSAISLIYSLSGAIISTLLMALIKHPSLPVTTSKILVKLCTYIFTKNHIKTPIFA